jgi:hypothetical protein
MLFQTMASARGEEEKKREREKEEQIAARDQRKNICSVVNSFEWNGGESKYLSFVGILSSA